MSDSDKDSGAWRLAPSDYLAAKEIKYALPNKPFSTYVTMDDGCRLAADVYLPVPKAGVTAPETFPTIAIFTPYYRRFALVDDTVATERSPNVHRYRNTFVPHGYALVVVDVRGTGASFGCRDSFRSPREREDYRAVADWIVAQPWSNGAIGSTGISYLGAASDFLLTSGHPAVKAVAPLFAVFDTYLENCYPGGLLLLNRLAGREGQLMIALDRDLRDERRKYAYFADPNLASPQPVDDDADGALCAAAVAEHHNSFHMADFITEFRFKDSALPYDPSFTPALMGPYHYAAEATPGTAVLCVSGWMDGAAYTNGSISRFLTYADGRPTHLLLGPWDHGARANVSPYRDKAAPDFPILAEVLRFFDHYLCGIANGYEQEEPVHYFSMHDERWRTARQWPPSQGKKTLYLASDNQLSDAPGAGKTTYKVNLANGTGRNTRYERAAGFDNTSYYPDWAAYQESFLNFTSEPLDSALTIAGHVVLSVELSADQPDAAILGYLTEIKADGSMHYVTEGALRALHRALSDPPETYRCNWPYHSMERKVAAPLVPGQPTKIEFALQPTSWTFERGSRLRLSIAGGDADHFGQVPHGRPPVLDVLHGGDSWVRLPIVP